MMRHFLAGLAILVGGVLGMFAAALLNQTLTDQVLGPGRAFSDGEPLVHLLGLAPMVLTPMLVVGVLLSRGRTSELGLFLLGWGCPWPIVLAYAVFGTVAARLSGGLPPSISLASGTAPIFLGLFFAVLPLAGLWFIVAGRRQSRVDPGVSPS